MCWTARAIAKVAVRDAGRNSEAIRVHVHIHIHIPHLHVHVHVHVHALSLRASAHPHWPTHNQGVLPLAAVIFSSVHSLSIRSIHPCTACSLCSSIFLPEFVHASSGHMMSIHLCFILQPQ